MASKKTTSTLQRRRPRRGATRVSVSQDILNDADARFRMLLELSSDWYWEQDKNLRFTTLTRKIETEARFAASDSIGKQRWELPYCDVTEEQWEAHKALLYAREPFYDFVLKRRDREGEVRYSCISGIPFYDRDGNFKGYRGIGRDITERIQAEAREAMTHAIARLLAESTAVAEAMPKIVESICSIIGWQYGAYWTIDRKEHAVRCANMWCVPTLAETEFVKFTREVASVAIDLEYDNLTESRGVIRHVAATGEPVWFEDMTEHESARRCEFALEGGLRAAFAFPITVNDETFGIMEFFSHETRKPDPELMNMTLTIGRQIGQFCRRKQTEAALHDANQTLQTLVQTSPLAIYTFDLDGRVTLWNPAAERIFGWTEAEALGQSLPFVPTEKQEEFRKFRKLILGGDTFTNVEMVRQRRDGTRIDISVSTAPLSDAAGRLVGVMSVTADITERKHAEARQAMEHAVTRMMLDPDTADDIIPKIIQAICESLGWDYGAYWGLQREQETLCRIQAWNVSSIDVTDFVKQSESEVLHIQSTASPTMGGVIRRAWLSDRPIWTVDVTQDPTFRRAPFAKKVGFHTAVAFPITGAGNSLGVMEFFTRDSSHPDENLMRGLQKIGGQIGQFIERQNADIRQEMEHAVTRLLAESDSPSEVVPEIIKTICKTLRWDYGGYWALDDQNQSLQCKDIWYHPLLEGTDFIEHCNGRILALGSRGLVGRTWVEDGPVWITDVTSEPGFARADGKGGEPALGIRLSHRDRKFQDGRSGVFRQRQSSAGRIIAEQCPGDRQSNRSILSTQTGGKGPGVRRDPRSMDLASESGNAQRTAESRARPSAAARHETCDLFCRPRPFQEYQRHPGARHRRSPVEGDGTAAQRMPAGERHGCAPGG